MTLGTQNFIPGTMYAQILKDLKSKNPNHIGETIENVQIHGDGTHIGSMKKDHKGNYKCVFFIPRNKIVESTLNILYNENERIIYYKWDASKLTGDFVTEYSICDAKGNPITINIEGVDRDYQANRFISAISFQNKRALTIDELAFVDRMTMPKK